MCLLRICETTSTKPFSIAVSRQPGQAEAEPRQTMPLAALHSSSNQVLVLTALGAKHMSPSADFPETPSGLPGMLKQVDNQPTTSQATYGARGHCSHTESRGKILPWGFLLDIQSRKKLSSLTQRGRTLFV